MERKSYISFTVAAIAYVILGVSPPLAGAAINSPTASTRLRCDTETTANTYLSLSQLRIVSTTEHKLVNNDREW